MSGSRLFQPLKIGDITLQHRVVMAPLTRYRADKNHVPLPLVKEYYAQRASTAGTLLITEATFISPQASGYANAPGIWNKEQVTAWKQVTDAVHAKGSYIFMQLWALGRVAQRDVLKAEGHNVKAPSSIGLEGLAVPEELTTQDIKSFLEEYSLAAKNAIEAGFDGVELHGANGYLVDQFIQDVTNQRTDEYGGSIENRNRFPLQVLQTLVSAIGANKVGVRLSPWSDFQGMLMADPIPQFTHLLNEAKKLKLAYIHLVESRISGNADVAATKQNRFAVDAWGKTSPVLLAGGFESETAKSVADEEYKDSDVAVVFGRHFIANPDLPFRIQKGLSLNPYNRDTFYKAESPVGYIDYPFSKEWVAVQA